MKLWELRSYDQVIQLEQSRLIERARLRARYGRRWRSKAPVQAVMALRLTRYGRPLALVSGVLDIEHAPAITQANSKPPAIEAGTFETAAEQAIEVVREPEHDDREQPNAVANKAATSANADREQPSMADLVRAQVALHPNNADAVRSVIANMPDANKASVAAAVRRERRRSAMDGGYG
jgi:hypothetical protein